jgi:tRNA G37 N-methylase TrmD
MAWDQPENAWRVQEAGAGLHIHPKNCDPAAVRDAVMRLLPGVLGNQQSLDEESFAGGGLEYPHYTRPREFRGREVPDVLLADLDRHVGQGKKFVNRSEAIRASIRKTLDLLDEIDDRHGRLDGAAESPDATSGGNEP